MGTEIHDVSQWAARRLKGLDFTAIDATLGIDFEDEGDEFGDFANRTLFIKLVADAGSLLASLTKAEVTKLVETAIPRAEVLGVEIHPSRGGAVVEVTAAADEASVPY